MHQPMNVLNRWAPVGLRGEVIVCGSLRQSVILDLCLAWHRYRERNVTYGTVFEAGGIQLTVRNSKVGWPALRIWTSHRLLIVR